MKIRILFAVLCLGILVGVTLFHQETPTATGTATFDCYVENQPCNCNSEQCVCGNQTVPASYCIKKV